jgi:hypothetical protein
MEIETAVQAIAVDVGRWGPGVVMKEFCETRVPHELLKTHLANTLGREYVVFMGPSGIVVKRRGL